MASGSHAGLRCYVIAGATTISESRYIQGLVGDLYAH